MRLTTYSDYALRVLMHVALRDGERVRIVEIADSFGISHNHLTKVVHNLATLGCLVTVQGRNGGMRLARPPADITVGQIVRAFEPDFRLVQCSEPETSHCVVLPACVLKGVLQRAAENFLYELDQVTLADLLQPRRKLSSLLELPAS